MYRMTLTMDFHSFFCRLCITQLLHFAKFKQKCNETYNKFQNLLIQTKIEVKMEQYDHEHDDDQINWTYDHHDNISVCSEYTKIETSNDDNGLFTELTYNIDSDKVDSKKKIQLKPKSNGIRSKTNKPLNTKPTLQLICEICQTVNGNKFKSIPILESHMSRVHGMATNLRQSEHFDNHSEEVPHDQLQVHNTKLHTKPICEYCHKMYSSKKTLYMHIRTHTGEKPYKCEYCDKCFTSKSYLVIHTRTHTGEKPYKCEYCGKCFSLKSNLVIHTRTHTGDQPYKCEVCNIGFSVNSSLVMHTRTHTGEKPYQCQICDRNFSQKSLLLKHLRTHTGEKPYKCDYCDKCFGTKSQSSQHTRTHTGEKPFECEYCLNCFSTYSGLARHISSHLVEKPYKCEYCNKCFSRNANLVKHTRNTHSLCRT